MKTSRTTLAGAASAIGLALAAVPGLPPSVHTAAVCLASGATALLGFFADSAKAPDVSPRATLAALAASVATVTVAGCTLAGLKFKVSNPTFGALAIDLEGGSLWRPGCTNTTTTNTATLK